MKIILTNAEAKKILCEAVKKRYEEAFHEANGTKPEYNADHYWTFDVAMDGEVCGRNNTGLSPDAEINFEAVHIEKVMKRV
jgi:hypothetical protein